MDRQNQSKSQSTLIFQQCLYTHSLIIQYTQFYYQSVQSLVFPSYQQKFEQFVMSSSKMQTNREEFMNSIRKNMRKSIHEGSVKKLRQQIYNMMNELTPQDLQVIDQIEREEREYGNYMQQMEQESIQFEKAQNMRKEFEEIEQCDKNEMQKSVKKGNYKQNRLINH